MISRIRSAAGSADRAAIAAARSTVGRLTRWVSARTSALLSRAHRLGEVGPHHLVVFLDAGSPDPRHPIILSHRRFPHAPGYAAAPFG